MRLRKQPINDLTGTPVTADVVAKRVPAFLRTAHWIFVGLGVTVGVAYAVAGSPAIMQTIASSHILGVGALIAELGLVLYLSTRVQNLTDSECRHDARSALLRCVEWGQSFGPRGQAT
jgi:FtsH-binding integral membrane protein